MKPRLLVRILLLLVVVGLVGYLYLEREMHAFHTPSSTAPLEITPGMSARDVLKLLRERGVIADERLTMAYLVLSRQPDGPESWRVSFRPTGHDP